MNYTLQVLRAVIIPGNKGVMELREGKFSALQGRGGEISVRAESLVAVDNDRSLTRLGQLQIY